MMAEVARLLGRMSAKAKLRWLLRGWWSMTMSQRGRGKPRKNSGWASTMATKSAFAKAAASTRRTGIRSESRMTWFSRRPISPVKPMSGSTPALFISRFSPQALAMASGSGLP